MGNRGQVLIKDESIYLYTHWQGSNLINIVREALSRKQCWDDPEYLARIVFSTMTKGYEDEETGFGIGNKQHGDINFLIELDCATQQIRIVNILTGKEEFKTFKEFVK